MTSYTILAFALLMASFIANLNAHPTQESTECGEGYYRCQNEDLCIPEEWKCDGGHDCRDGDDERQNCQDRQCEEGYFMCDGGLCIPRTWMCDKDNDCEDATDERDCTYVPETPSERNSHRHRHLTSRRR